MIGNEEIENRFGFHKATIEGYNATLPKHRDVRLLFREFGEKLDAILPEGRTTSLFWTNLETASMWAHKAIAELAPAVDETRDDLVLKRVWNPEAPICSESELVRHAEKQGCSYRDAYSYFEGLGYNMQFVQHFEFDSGTP
jgi:hypothetical protein